MRLRKFNCITQHKLTYSQLSISIEFNGLVKDQRNVVDERSEQRLTYRIGIANVKRRTCFSYWRTRRCCFYANFPRQCMDEWMRSIVHVNETDLIERQVLTFHRQRSDIVIYWLVSLFLRSLSLFVFSSSLTICTQTRAFVCSSWCLCRSNTSFFILSKKKKNFIDILFSEALRRIWASAWSAWSLRRQLIVIRVMDSFSRYVEIRSTRNRHRMRNSSSGSSNATAEEEEEEEKAVRRTRFLFYVFTSFLFFFFSTRLFAHFSLNEDNKIEQPSASFTLCLSLSLFF